MNAILEIRLPGISSSKIWISTLMDGRQLGSVTTTEELAPETLSHFSTSFKKQFGVPPSEYVG